MTIPLDPNSELQRLRVACEALAARLDLLAAQNQSLQERLQRSESQRADLAAQTAHIVELLAQARTELRSLRPDPA